MKLPIIQRRTLVRQGKGLPLPTVIKHTITHTLGILIPKVYSREVRRPYTGEELRELREERGVGTPPSKLWWRENKRNFAQWDREEAA